MIKCSIELSKFKNIINLLSICNKEECRLNISEKGWKVGLANNVNVAMICVDVPNTSFNSYKCTKEEEIGFNYKELLAPKIKLLNKLSRFGDIVNIEIKDKIIIKCGNYTYSLDFADLNEIRQKPRIPQIDLNSKFTISSKNLFNTIDMFEDQVLIQVKDNIISFDDTNNKHNISFKDEINIIESNDARSLFSIDYLSPAIKIIKSVCSNVDIHLGNDYPIIIKNNNSDITFTYLQAPRIERD